MPVCLSVCLPVTQPCNPLLPDCALPLIAIVLRLPCRRCHLFPFSRPNLSPFTIYHLPFPLPFTNLLPYTIYPLPLPTSIPLLTAQPFTICHIHSPSYDPNIYHLPSCRTLGKDCNKPKRDTQACQIKHTAPLLTGQHSAMSASWLRTQSVRQSIPGPLWPLCPSTPFPPSHLWNKDPMRGCPIGTKCPNLHAK
jgi:hypothetical protein